MLPARVAKEYNRLLVLDLTGVEERVHAGLVRKAKEEESDAWRRFKVFPPLKMGTQSNVVVDTRWVLPWKAGGGQESGEGALGSGGLSGSGS